MSSFFVWADSCKYKGWYSEMNMMFYYLNEYKVHIIQKCEEIDVLLSEWIQSAHDTEMWTKILVGLGTCERLCLSNPRKSVGEDVIVWDDILIHLQVSWRLQSMVYLVLLVSLQNSNLASIFL